jgi:hypothetical protein
MRKLAVFPVLLLLAWFGYQTWRPVAARSQTGATPANVFQYRIIVGLTDTEAKTWKGTISVTGGTLGGVEGWHFSQADRAQADGAFEFQTRIGNLENQLLREHPYGQTDWSDPRIRRLVPEGLIVRVQGSPAARVRFDSPAGSFEFPADLPLGRRLAVLAGNGAVEPLPIEEKLSEQGTLDDYPAIVVTPKGERWAVWLAYQKAADEVVAAGGGKIYRLTGRGDHHAPAIAAAGDGSLTAVWSQNDSGTFHLYASTFERERWSQPERLTGEGGSNMWPRLASDGAGKMALVWQAFRQNQSVIAARLWDGKRWGAETRVSEGPGNCWTPSAAFGGGKLHVAWDSYATGAYQAYAREWGKPVERITRGENFSVRPSVAVTATGVPVVAWEESAPLWGKDFAFLTDQRGAVIYKDRRIRVAARDGADWKELPGAVAESLPVDIRRFVQQPELAMDAAGRLYMAFRCRTSTGAARIDYWANAGRWETFLTWLDGERWSPAVLMPSSVGRNGMRAAIALGHGQVHVAWPTDRRVWPGGARYGDLDVLATALPGDAPAAQLRGGRPLAAEPAPVPTMHPNENDDTRRIRAYRYSVAGQQYRILRGDLHRHTELSGDGAGDGSLDDLYRYTLDAAQMDYAHVGDHQMGNDEEYNWWLTQKSNDLYCMPGRFVPMYGYERSVWYPNGHRNVVWAERGKPVLKIGQAEAKGAADSGPILYPYLKETGGIATSHSSATDQGTDWRDNDPLLEPLVEIYQGFESNYEHQDAPRAWREGMKPVHQGLRPLGYIWNAWAKGYKLGVQSSSDHISTHTSYACILAVEFTRQGLLQAMRRRHAYAATDQIVLDFRIATADAGEHLMGDIFDSSAPPKLIVKAIGTAAIERMDVIKNNTYIHQVSPKTKEASFEYVDLAAQPGENYYYVRVQQTDGQLAWSSPIWVRYKK